VSADEGQLQAKFALASQAFNLHLTTTSHFLHLALLISIGVSYRCWGHVKPTIQWLTI